MRGSVFLIVLAVAGIGCGMSDGAAPADAFRVDSLVVAWKDTATARVTNAPSSSSPVEWSVADTTVATVDPNGVLTGRHRGATVLTARVDDHVATATVRVEVRFIGLATGPAATCGLLRAGQVYCWGDNGSGLLLNELASSFALPEPTSANVGFYWEVQAGGQGRSTVTFAIDGGPFICGITTTGRVDCWGVGSNGQRGTATFFPVVGARDPVQLPEPVVVLRAGTAHACALTGAGDAYCWGRSDAGQLGVAGISQCSRAHFSYACSAVPVHAVPSYRFSRIALGGATTCGVTVDSSTICWGRALLPGVAGGATPYSVPLPTATRELAVGESHACALTSSGEAWCWGANDAGQLGLGVVDTSQSMPRPLPTFRFARIAVNGNSTCGVTTSHDLYCWGDNSFGQLGDGSTTNRSTPTRVLLDGPASNVWLAEDHSCALIESGAAYCWGAGGYGQLGHGIQAGSTFPTPVVTPP